MYISRLNATYKDNPSLFYSKYMRDQVKIDILWYSYYHHLQEKDKQYCRCYDIFYYSGFDAQEQSFYICK